MAALVRVLGAVLFLGGSSLSLAQDAASCLECHSLPDQELLFRSGEKRSATIDPLGWDASVHGAGGLDCTACHTEHAEYPHAEVKDDSVRAYALTQSRACEACHEEQVKQFADGVHHAMHGAGNAKAAVCADCHDPHAGRRLTDPDHRTLLPEARRAIPCADGARSSCPSSSRSPSCCSPASTGSSRSRRRPSRRSREPSGLLSRTNPGRPDRSAPPRWAPVARS